MYIYMYAMHIEVEFVLNTQALDGNTAVIAMKLSLQRAGWAFSWENSYIKGQAPLCIC